MYINTVTMKSVMMNLCNTKFNVWNPFCVFAVFLTVMDNENKDDLKPNLECLESEIKEKQSARCLLREKFLRAVTGIVGKECTLHMYPSTNVDGVFRGNDIEFETILVERLKTPFAEIPHSKIRSSDVNYIEFKNVLNS